jgi:hypothetical protein
MIRLVGIFLLATIVLPRLASGAEDPSVPHYFTASAVSLEPECKPAGATLEQAKMAIQEGVLKGKWFNTLTFNGKLPGAFAYEVFNDANFVTTWVIGVDLESCEEAKKNYPRIREEMESARLAALPPDKKRKRPGRLIFDMLCTQTTALDGSRRTTCQTRQVCKQITIKGQFAGQPVSLTVPCKDATIAAE